MPLVRIEILKGRPTAERKQLLQAVHPCRTALL